MQKTTRFYVYIIKDPFTKEVFYVGKGTGSRLMEHVKETRPTRANNKYVNKRKFARIQSILNRGKSPILKKVQTNLTEQTAFDLERTLIQKYKLKEDGGTLLNKCRGGSTPAKIPVKINQYSYFGDFLKTFENIHDACEAINCRHPSSLYNACRHKVPSYKGFLWCFDGDSPTIPNTILFHWSLDGCLLRKFKNQGEAHRFLKCTQAALHNSIFRPGDINIRTIKNTVITLTEHFPGTPIKRIRGNAIRKGGDNSRSKKCRHINTNTLYNSITEAAIATKHSIQAIVRCCKRQQDNVSGDRFEYVLDSN